MFSSAVSDSQNSPVSLEGFQNGNESMERVFLCYSTIESSMRHVLLFSNSWRMSPVTVYIDYDGLQAHDIGEHLRPSSDFNRY